MTIQNCGGLQGHGQYSDTITTGVNPRTSITCQSCPVNFSHSQNIQKGPPANSKARRKAPKVVISNAANLEMCAPTRGFRVALLIKGRGDASITGHAYE